MKQIPHNPDLHGLLLALIWLFHRGRRLLRAIWRFISSDEAFYWMVTAAFILATVFVVICLFI